MDKSSLLVWAGVILAVVIGIGQESDQSWKLRPNGNSDTVQFTIHRFKPGSNWTWSEDVPLSRFRNLSADTLEHGGRAEFDYVTDAGKLHCKGSFSWHSGAGSFTFTASPEFVGELRNLGFGAPSQEQAMDMLISDVSLEYARAVRDAGVHASTGQLLELRHHGVNAKYLREVKDDGYDFSVADLVELKDHGVDGDLLRELKRANFDFTTSQIVEMRDHGVGPDFLRDLKSLGIHPHASEIVQFRDHGISADYLGDLKAAGYGELSGDQIIGLRDHGVPADFVREAQELGYKFTAQELIGLRDHGVSAEYLRTLKESGIRPLTADQIEKLRMHGVE